MVTAVIARPRWNRVNARTVPVWCLSGTVMASPSAGIYVSLPVQAIPPTENDHRACLHHLIALIHDLNLKSDLAASLISDFLVRHPDAGGNRVPDEHRAYQPEAIDTVEGNDVPAVP